MSMSSVFQTSVFGLDLLSIGNTVSSKKSSNDMGRYALNCFSMLGFTAHADNRERQLASRIVRIFLYMLAVFEGLCGFILCIKNKKST